METHLPHFFKRGIKKNKSHSIAKGNKERVIIGMGNVWRKLSEKSPGPEGFLEYLSIFFPSGS